MKKIILSFLLLSGILMAELQQVWSTPGFADKGINGKRLVLLKIHIRSCFLMRKVTSILKAF